MAEKTGKGVAPYKLNETDGMTSKWHLYLGFCRENADKIADLQKKLNDLGVKCYTRFGEAEEKSRDEIRVDEGIYFSQRCLLYVSDNYLEDNLSQREMENAAAKAAIFGNRSVFALNATNVQKMAFVCKDFTILSLNDNWKKTIVESLPTELRANLQTMSKLNVGTGIAYTYYYGFLQIHLKDLKKRFLKEIHENIGLDNKRIIRKFLIIIPASLNCPPKLTFEDKLLQTKMTVFRCASRAGREARDYTIPIYKLTVNEPCCDYYFLMDIPACLLALYETYIDGLAGLTTEQLFKARNEFYFTLKAILDHPDNADCRNQWKLVLWPDNNEDEERGDGLYKFISQQLSEEFQNQEDDDEYPETELKTLQTAKESFIVDDNMSCTPEYRKLEFYKISSKPKGICIIINNSKFIGNLKERTGSHRENELLKLAFHSLSFKVRLFNDLNEVQMRTKLQEACDEDHTSYDAFACCILTHGCLGSVYSSDCKQIKIVKILGMFTDENCPSLKGKPKLFFIEACQDIPNTGNSNSSSQVDVCETANITDSDLVNYGNERECVYSRDLRANASPDNPATSTDNPATSADNPATFPDNSVSRQSERRDQEMQLLVPSNPDFLMSFSTLPSSVAWGCPITGGIYTQVLAKNLQKKNTEIEALMNCVKNDVDKKIREYTGEGCSYKQLPVHVFTGKKMLIID